MSTLYEAVREADGLEVVLKTYARASSPRTLERVRREFDILRRVEGPGVPRAIALDETGDGPVLILERLPGIRLSTLLADGPLDVRVWLHLAEQLAETLAQVHAVRVLHKDLTPDNILVDTSRDRVAIVDFGLSMELGAAESFGSPMSGTLDGSLLYVAPEQTGRMNRGCDFRSDLYALGGVLYRALTGRPPFDANDVLELVHAHLARVPDPPVSLRPDLPHVLSEMVQKLLRKEPEERYQSARALQQDLRACIAEVERSGAIPSGFALETTESPGRPLFPAKLYGREREIALLRQVYADAAQGRIRTLWIHGEPGAGKSVLVDQLRELVAETQGYVACGKFDLYRTRAYSGWVAALGSLAQQLLIQSDASLARWREELLGGLGAVAPAILDLAPDLAFVLGELEPLPPVGPRETLARLGLALQRFAGACARPEHPLVLFLDDLQWSDPASRALIEEIVTGPPSALLLIGAYRASEVGATHPVHRLVDRLESSVPSESIELGPLPRDAVVAMLADALERTPDEARELAELAARRTGSSPLLVQQLVEHVHGSGFLHHVPGSGWTWDAQAIAAMDLPDGAVGLMTRKLERLAPAVLSVLQFASCVGDEFDVDLLARLDRRQRAEIERAVFELADEGLILPCARGFRFAHDRIREAAQQQLSNDERTRIHHDTARLLLERTPDDAQAPFLLEIVEHLNRGMEHASPGLRLRAIELNVRVGDRALAQGASSAAREHFAVARDLLRGRAREVSGQLVLHVALQGAECAYQEGCADAALALLDEIELEGLTPMERARVDAKRLQVFAVSRPADVTVRRAIEVMRRLGVRWTLHPSRLRARIALWRLWRELRGRSLAELVQPARAFDAEWIAPLLMLRATAASLVRVDVHLAALATCLSLRLQIRHGHVGAVGFAIAVYATYLYLFWGDAARARELAEHALARAAESADTEPRCRHMVEAVLYPFLMERRAAIADLPRIAEEARESGDREFAYFAQFTGALYLALAGDPVAVIAERLDRLSDELRGAAQLQPEAMRCRRVYRLLALDDVAHAELEAAWDEDRDARAGMTGTVFYGDLLWMIVWNLFGRPERVLAISDLTMPTLFRISPFVQVIDHLFYRGLAAATLARSTRGFARRRFRRVLGRCIRQIEGWGRRGPDFVHMEALLRAEWASTTGSASRARSLYAEAAGQAAARNYPHHVALAHERLALSLAASRRETDADAALANAVRAYRAWGAHGKAARIERELEGPTRARRAG